MPAGAVDDRALLLQLGRNNVGLREALLVAERERDELALQLEQLLDRVARALDPERQGPPPSTTDLALAVEGLRLAHDAYSARVCELDAALDDARRRVVAVTARLQAVLG